MAKKTKSKAKKGNKGKKAPPAKKKKKKKKAVAKKRGARKVAKPRAAPPKKTAADAQREAENAKRKAEKAEQAVAKAQRKAEKARREAEKVAAAKAQREAERERLKAGKAAAAKAQREAEKARLDAEKAEKAATAKAQREADKAEKAAAAQEQREAENARREAEKVEKAGVKKARREATAKPEPRPAVPSPRYYLTTPIFYPNGAPHIGHAYTALTSDAIARFERLDGKDVFFLTGTDEHGLKMKQTAIAEGLAPRELADRNSQRFRDMMAALDISQDDFIRTTEPRHHRASQEIWRRMEAAGDIYLGKYAGWYSVRQEGYFLEKETTLGPDGVRREPLGSPVEWTEEETYFFRLSAYQERLLAHCEANPDFIGPLERRNEVVSFVKGGLEDLAISRATLDWGIPVPSNPKHVMYVWVDALTNYITGVGFPDTGSAEFRRYWPADLHVIGKDILRFHAVYWPAFLMSAGVELPRRIFSHGFLLSRGEKMSKSVGNVMDPFALADLYGVDPLRFFFLREVPFGQDGSYSHEAIVNRINADLANDLGNLAQRSLTMIARQLAGALPKPGAFSEADKAMLAAADAMVGKSRDAMKTQGLHHVLNTVWAVVAEANRYFAGEAPWALAKTDPARQGTVLFVTAEVIRQVAILAQPFMPVSAAKLLDLLGVPSGERDFATLGGSHRLAPGISLPAPSPVFPRFVEAEASPAS